ncbi:MAG: recombinase RecA [Mycoplasmoidaceae bacterium]|nr:MAG: recombinase RecA [Mycoplasmoidaceae bacterium]
MTDIINETIKKLQNQFGKGTILNINNQKELIEVIPSGSLMLDNILGVGGFPKGRITEIYGNESCGKTTISLQAVVQCQGLGGKCVYIDLEHALDLSYCKKLGIDLDNLIVIQPESAEQTFSIIEALLKTGTIDLIVVDSVAALVPKAELDGDFGDQTMGLHARIMSKGLRIIQTLLEKNSTAIIFINQIREKIGVMYGNNETTTGGRALRFYASLRLELRRSELLKDSDNVIGIKIAVKTVKNKLAPPMQKAFVDIFFDKGYDETNEIIDFALEKGVIEKRGSWFYYKDEKIGQGKDNTKKILLENSDLYLKVKDDSIKAVVQQDDVIKLTN